MEYSLYRLNFTTALHIGRDSGGASLDDGQMTIHADTIFSALCCETAHDRRMTQLVESFSNGSLVISNALPFSAEELFLPKPILFTGHKKREGDAGLKKALKSLDFIPLSQFRSYLDNLNQPAIEMEKLKYDFGQLSTSTRVAIKGNDPPLPYHVASWRFAPGCGLYIVVGYEDENALKTLTSALNSLGLSGIGGKKTSGWGKFELKQDSVPALMMELLNDREAEYQMMLGTGLPIEAELEETLQDSWFTLIRRGGFIHSEGYASGQLKKKTIYMLGPGSCLRRRFRGKMHDLSDNGSHPIYRNSSTLFVGVNL